MIEPPSVSLMRTAWVTIRLSTSSGSRLELTASPRSRSASSCSTLLASSDPRVSSEVISSTCRSTIAAWAAKALDELDLLLVERVDLEPPDREGADHLVVEDHRRRHQGPIAGQLLEVLAPVLRVGEDVGDLQRVPVGHHPAEQRAAVARGGVRQRVQRGTPRGPAVTCATDGRPRRRRGAAARRGPGTAARPARSRCRGSRPGWPRARASATRISSVATACSRASTRARSSDLSVVCPTAADLPVGHGSLPRRFHRGPGRRIAATPVWIASPPWTSCSGWSPPRWRRWRSCACWPPRSRPVSSAAGASRRGRSGTDVPRGRRRPPGVGRR